MLRNKKTLLALLGAVVLMAVAGLALLPAASARAAGFTSALLHGGRGGPMGNHGENDTYLAEALGITVDELQSAKTAAWEAAVDQALDQGMITQAQADRLKSAAGGFHGHGLGLLGFLAGDEDAFDFDALLAEQLNISVDELTDARDHAFEMRIQAGLDSGQLTQEQAELMRARHALEGSIDHESLVGGALGISVEELQTARQDGKSLSDLITRQGLSTDEFQTKIQAAYEEAVQQAVEDGVITADQAALLLQNADNFGKFGGGPGFHGGPGH
jgi:hypothetical protein